MDDQLIFRRTCHPLQVRQAPSHQGRVWQVTSTDSAVHAIADQIGRAVQASGTNSATVTAAAQQSIGTGQPSTCRENGVSAVSRAWIRWRRRGRLDGGSGGHARRLLQAIPLQDGLDGGIFCLRDMAAIGSDAARQTQEVKRNIESLLQAFEQGVQPRSEKEMTRYAPIPSTPVRISSGP